MKNMKLKIFSLIMAASVLLSGCNSKPPADTTGDSGPVSGTTASTTVPPEVGRPVVNPENYNDAEISEAELYDKMMGGWLGQMIGVA